MNGKLWWHPAGGEWKELGATTGDGLVYEPPPIAPVRAEDDRRAVRAWVRIGPDGAFTMDAPLVEVDPTALIIMHTEETAFDRP